MQETSKNKTVITFLLGVIATVGIARFSYTPMIPEMIEELGMTEAMAGYLAAANYIGYLCGTVCVSFISSLGLKARLFKLGLVLSVVTSSAMGMSTSEYIWILMRFISGLSSAAGMLLGAGLLMHWLIRHNHKAVLGNFFSGLGIGIAMTAVTAKLASSHLSWDMQWHLYGFITLLLVLPVFKWLPNFSTEQPLAQDQAKKAMHSGWFMPVLQGAYFCAGVGYVVSATFLIAIAESIPELEGYGWILWLVTGVACAPASSLWDKLTHRIGTWISLLIAYFLKSLSLIILILSQDLIAVVFSALLFGASFIGIVSMVLAMVGRLYPDNPSKPMSRLTFSYGLAQIIAPAVIGYMANRYGSFESGLALTLLVVVMGMIFLTSAWVIENNKRKRLYLTA